MQSPLTFVHGMQRVFQHRIFSQEQRLLRLLASQLNNKSHPFQRDSDTVSERTHILRATGSGDLC